MVKGMWLRSTLEIPTWRSKKIIQNAEKVLGHAITAIIRGRDGKLVTGVVGRGKVHAKLDHGCFAGYD